MENSNRSVIHYKKNTVILTIAGVLLLAVCLTFMVPLPQIPAGHAPSSGQPPSPPSQQQPSLRCNCVILRADDIQDYWEQKPQVALLDIFISKSVPLSVGLVMNHFGSDPVIVDKVKQGGLLFEYDIHGWDHVDYTTLSAREQEESISKAQAKMESVMGRNATVFLPPYNNFDAGTLTGMRVSGLDIISSSKADSDQYAPANDTIGVFHMPQSINYGYTDNPDSNNNGERHAWRTIAEMGSAVDADIDARGWAVVTVHPQDFAKYDEGGKMLDVVDEQKADTFKSFIDQLLAEGKTLTTFEGAMQTMRENDDDDAGSHSDPI